MNLSKFWIAAFAATAVALLDTGTSVANAESASLSDPNVAPVSASVSNGVQEILQMNPQAKLIAPNEVWVESNTSIVVTPALKENAAGASPTIYGCQFMYLCFSDAASWDQPGHYIRRWFVCEFLNLGERRYPDFAKVGTAAPGPKWNDRLSSYNNNQTRGTVSYFYNWVGSWALVHASPPAPSHVDDFNPLRINDIIDGIQVC